MKECKTKDELMDAINNWTWYDEQGDAQIPYEIALDAIQQALNLSNVSQQREMLFCGGCGDKRQLIVETDIISERVCKNKLCKQNNCG
jgi:hypothetical protein